jgi:hypothetical protein
VVLTRFIAVVSLLLALSVYATKPLQRLKVVAGTDHIDVDHATNGGKVLLIGYEQTARGYSRVFRRVEREGTADGKGGLRFEIGRPLAERSFWVAVDLTTTGYGAVTGDGKQLREGEILPDAFKKGTSHLDRALVRFDYVHVLVVRPESGVWELTTGDGGPFDTDDALDGKIELDVRKFAKRGDQSALDEYKNRDLVIVFVPHEMGYLITEVSQ